MTASIKGEQAIVCSL